MKTANRLGDLGAKLSDDAVAVFLFHGVTELVDYGVRNYTGKHIVRDDFVRIIRFLASTGNAVSMDDLYDHVAVREDCPKRSFVVTFDDGFWNNLSIAAPILEDFSIPATFFVTSDFVEFGSRSWTDRIEAAVAATTLGEISCPQPMEGNYPLATTADKIRFLQLARASVKSSYETDPDIFADSMVDSLIGSQELEFVETLDRKLNWDEVRKLDSHSLFTVGGHGKTHRILGYMRLEEMREEVNHCILALRRKGGVAADHFSYPEGFSGSYTSEVSDLLRESRVKTGVTTVPGINLPGQDPFELRRIFVA